ncbi:MAG: hypothetical protein WC100_00940 [Sterolibacterium sp.]
MTITTLPPNPDPATDTPTTFSTKAAVWVLALATFQAEANALAASMNSVAAGGAFAIPYTFSTTTTDSDPGAGTLRLDNATQNTATTIRADLLGSDGATWTGVIDTFADSSSSIKGQIKLVKVGDGTKWLAFNVTALASPSGYRNITVANVASSAASPFGNGDALMLFFVRTGDAGSITAASQAQMEAATSNTVMVTPLSVNWHPGQCKVWVKCDKNGAASASWNVTSVVDDAVGKVTITIATDFSSANYAIAAMTFGAGTLHRLTVEAQAAGTFQLTSYKDGVGYEDPGTAWFAACFGDQ